MTYTVTVVETVQRKCSFEIDDCRSEKFIKDDIKRQWLRNAFDSQMKKTESNGKQWVLDGRMMGTNTLDDIILRPTDKA